ncbi:hypothetical protein [Flavobacterium crassostreae]|uniref:DUF748 domain-containing protein n=1 Tax=Flavobacterium crassostreae TaxID=1763534 RepID=A0A1B9DZV6_9FLAO|nr:hypothetical protein [Flavobacterium crassostreae]OCB75232.1 hypothetical protein LPBF_09245 [Flavobacterium crassostreae]
MTAFKKIALGILVLSTLLILANVGLHFWIQKNITEIISPENTANHAITYQSLRIDLVTQSISVTGIVLIPKKKESLVKNKRVFYSKISEIKIQQFKIGALLFEQKFKANSVTILVPKIVVFQNSIQTLNQNKNTDPTTEGSFDKTIEISSLKVVVQSLDVVQSPNNKHTVSLKNLEAEINHIVIDQTTLRKKIPFLYQDYKIKSNSIYYRATDFYHMRAKNFETTKNTLKITGFQWIPEYSRSEFVSKLQTEKDLFKIQSSAIVVLKMDWGFKDEKPYFNVGKIAVEKLQATIYRNKMPADDKTPKPMYSQLLRDLKFPLRVDTLLVRNSVVIYEEEINFKKGAGKLVFDNFNLIATQIQSGYQLQKCPDVQIAIRCKFMRKSPFEVQWRFNVLDPKDAFTFTGKVYDLQAKQLSPFIKPYINTTTTGVFEVLEFTIKGNAVQSYQTAVLKYHNLKVTLYQKRNPQKKSVLKSALANLMVKKDTNGHLKTTTVMVTRAPEKSFFNFLWRNVAAVLKQLVI